MLLLIIEHGCSSRQFVKMWSFGQVLLIDRSVTTIRDLSGSEKAGSRTVLFAFSCVNGNSRLAWLWGGRIAKRPFHFFLRQREFAIEMALGRVNREASFSELACYANASRLHRKTGAQYT